MLRRNWVFLASKNVTFYVQGNHFHLIYEEKAINNAVENASMQILIEQLSQLETLNELFYIEYQLLNAGKVDLLCLNDVTEKNSIG